MLLLGAPDSYLISILSMMQAKLRFTEFFTFFEGVVSQVTFNTNKLLMKRYNLINKAKDSNVFGIVVTNPYVENFKSILQGTKDLLRVHGKKYYVFTMNKLNEAKIKNFPEVQTFIIISCPKSSFYEYSDFYKVVIVAHELRIALGEVEWDTNIFLDTKFDPSQTYRVDSEEPLEKKLENQLVALYV